MSQNGVTATNSVDGRSLSSHFFLDEDAYVLAQHATDLSWLTAKNPAHPGESIILHAANLGSVVNPPATGYPTPSLFSTIISEGRQTGGPLVLDLAHASVGILLFHDTYYNVPAVTIQSITLTPGAVSQYQIAIRLPMFSFPQDSTYSVGYIWSYCPDGTGTNPFCQGRQIDGSASKSWKIYLVSP